MNYDSSDFAGGVPMNEPDAVRCCAPAASAYSDGIPAGYLDNPCIPAGSHNRSHKVMEHRKLEIRNWTKSKAPLLYAGSINTN